MGLNAECRLTKQDWEFVQKLVRVAHVNVLSHQVSVNFTRSDRGNLGTDKKNPLVFPQNWSLQHVGIEPSKYEDNHVVFMIWDVMSINENNQP